MQKKTFNDNFKSHSISVLYILKIVLHTKWLVWVASENHSHKVFPRLEKYDLRK